MGETDPNSNERESAEVETNIGKNSVLQNGVVSSKKSFVCLNGVHGNGVVAADKVTHRKPSGKSRTSNGKISDQASVPLDRNVNINLSGLPGIGVQVMGLFMLSWPPLFVWGFWLACNSYQCSLGTLCENLISEAYNFTLMRYIRDHFPVVTSESLAIYFAWMVFQVALSLILPGKNAQGQVTPAGHQLTYKCNGLNAWVVSHLVFLALVLGGLIKMTVIADHWGSLMVIANCFGLGLSGFAFLKAHYFPTHPSDRCFSGSVFYDFFMGVELNPRIGNFDFKLFFNGRPGIVAWTLINLSFAAKQHAAYGYVTNSMILVNILHAIYVVDFFVNEDWYLRTIDIAHDHFGFYLAWGDSVWLPFMYTLQSCYLLYNPTILSWWAVTFVLVLGSSGYVIFRSVNSQKDRFRQEMNENGRCIIWGKPAEYVPAEYTTSLGEKKQTYLLAAGWWGLARHFNYLGDLMNALSYCLVCGMLHMLPYFYFVFMFVLLLHRTYRDDVKCRQKYGDAWQKYCRLVPYKIVPYVF